jgi:hypothetical protein
MKRASFHIIAGLIAWVSFGCETVVDLELPDGQELVVIDGWYTTQNIEQIVRVNTTDNYFSNEALPPVTNATVVIEDQTTGSFDTLSEKTSERGVYATNKPAQVGHTYKLHVRTTQGQQYESTAQYCQPVSLLDTIYNLYDDESAIFDPGFEIVISSSDPGDVDNWYRWRLYVNDVYQNKPSNISITSDDFVNGNEVSNITIERIDEGEAADQVLEGDTVRLEQLSISEAFFDYMSQISRQTAFVGSIFDTPPEPIEGNLRSTDDDPNKKPLGFFEVSDMHALETVITKEE